MQLKGRHWLGLWFLGFLIVAAIVVERQASARAIALRLGQLRSERTTLEAARAELERRIHVASSRQVLIPRAERLGLRRPDSAFTLFGIPAYDPEDP
jgi:hypothetical protein